MEEDRVKMEELKDRKEEIKKRRKKMIIKKEHEEIIAPSGQ